MDSTTIPETRREVEKLEIENQTLEEVLDFLIVRDILENDGNENFIAAMLKKRLEKNRCELLNCPQNLPTFIISGTEIPTQKILLLIFEMDEKKYLEILKKFRLTPTQFPNVLDIILLCWIITN